MMIIIKININSLEDINFEPYKTQLSNIQIKDKFSQFEILFSIWNFINDTNGDDKTIDLLINLYLNNSFGSPNSLSNMVLFKNIMNQIQFINNNSKFNNGKKIEYYNFSSLDELSEEICSKQNIITEINEHKKQKKIKSAEQKSIEKGSKDVNVILDNNKVIIYNPTTINGAKYYGRFTKWCTSANQNNMFDYYNNLGPLYIINDKKTGNKYQFHFNEFEFRDQEDFEVSLLDVINKIDDDEFKSWLCIKIIDYIKYKKDDLTIDYELYNVMIFYKLFDDKDLMASIQKIIFKDEKYDIDNKIFKLLKNLLYLSVTITEPLDNAFDNLINLNTLDICSFVPLNDSLNKLINLTTLDIYSYVPLNNSLNNLINLNILRLELFDNIELNDSLKKLTNLKYLELDVKTSIGEAFKNLKNLENLTIKTTNFNKFDGTVFLDVNYFNKLTKLTKLTIGKNIYLDNFRSNLDNITELHNESSQSLYYLYNFPNLQILYLTHSYDYINDYITIRSLENLKSLSLGDKFNMQPKNIFNELNNLEILNFGNSFNQPLGNSLANLTALKELTFGNNFNQPLENSLANLTALKELIFGNDFNQPLGNSLANLINLEELIFGDDFNQELNEPLENLSKLKILITGEKFDKQLNEKLNKIHNV